MEPSLSVETATAAPAPARAAILVLGMHRSGTSALAGVLAQLGCDAPATPMEANEGNAKGYFESRRVYELHNEMLASAGSHWTDWAPLDPAWFASAEARAFRDRAAEVVEAEFGDSPLFVLKDPRICRTAPLWLEVLRARGVTPLAVLTHRHPLEVAASLEKRNGMDRDTALLLWLRHVLDAEATSRGIARAHTSYDRLLGDWTSVVRGIEERLGLDWPDGPSGDAGRRVGAFLSGGLRHHDAGGPEPDLPSWVSEARTVVARWAERGEDAEGRDALDRVRAAFDAAAPVMAPAAERWRQARGTLSDALARSERVALERGSALARAEAELAAARERADRLEAELGVRMEELARAAQLALRMRLKSRKRRQEHAERLRALRADLSAERARLRSALASNDAERRASEAARLQAEEERRAVLGSTSWRLTAPLRALVDRARGRGG